MHRYLFAIFTLSAGVLAAAHGAEITRVNATTLRLYGTLQTGDTAALEKLYTPQTNLLVVRSPGGNSEEGMLMGRFIHDKKLDLEIEKTCASSCANYLFPAARHKMIPAGAVLAFHGTAYLTAQAGEPEIRAQLSASGMTPDQLKTAVPSMLTYVERLARLETAYAPYIGVPLQFYRDFKIVEEQSEPLQRQYGKEEPAPLWWPSAQRMSACYAIHDVDDRARPAELASVGHVHLAEQKWLLLGDKALPACTP